MTAPSESPDAWRFLALLRMDLMKLPSKDVEWVRSEMERMRREIAADTTGRLRLAIGCMGAEICVGRVDG